MRSARSMGRSPYGIRVPRTVWLRHPLSLAHEVPGHPERPERIVALEAEMERHDWFGCTRVLAPAAGREALLAVHTAEHVDFIEALCARGGGFIDQDTAAVPATWEGALQAAGGAPPLVDEPLSGDAATGVSALPPPGHHAEPDRAMGFCFFDNVAVAARRAAGGDGPGGGLVLAWGVHPRKR